MPINTENFRKIYYIISEIQRQKEREKEINKRKKKQTDIIERKMKPLHPLRGPPLET